MTDQNELTKLQEEMEARKAELAAVTAKMKEVERAEREARHAAIHAEKLATARKQNQETYAKYKPTAEAICAAVAELGYVLTFEEPNFDHSYFPKFNDYFISFWTVGKYTNYSRNPGKPAVRVEVATTPRTYPIRKDNTFNVQKISEGFVENIKIRIATDKRRNDENNRYKVNSQLKKQVAAAAGLHDYTSVVSGNKYKLNKVDLSIHIGEVDGERAIEILQALKEMGIELR